MEATRKALEASDKLPTKAPSGQRKNAKVPGWHKYCQEGEKSKSRAAKGKEPVALVKGTPTPKARPNLVKELCIARPREDGRDYHVIRVSNQLEHAPDTSLEVNLSQLMHGMWIWQDDEASTSQHYYMALIDRVHDVGRVITAYDNKSDVLQKEVQRLKLMVTSTQSLWPSNEHSRPNPWQTSSKLNWRKQLGHRSG
ncbi:hypothetical protein BHE74_00058629 [Ensete ventricosum]|nr:hypothetical protein BHE74_00058629 [Ensete ventricosum]